MGIFCVPLYSGTSENSWWGSAYLIHMWWLSDQCLKTIATALGAWNISRDVLTRNQSLKPTYWKTTWIRWARRTMLNVLFSLKMSHENQYFQGVPLLPCKVGKRQNYTIVWFPWNGWPKITNWYISCPWCNLFWLALLSNEGLIMFLPCFKTMMICIWVVIWAPEIKKKEKVESWQDSSVSVGPWFWQFEFASWDPNDRREHKVVLLPPHRCYGMCNACIHTHTHTI